jgi:hypothetical protein
MIATVLHISKPLWTAVKEIAAAEDRSAASVVREAISDLLQQRTYVARKPLAPRRKAGKPFVAPF